MTALERFVAAVVAGVLLAALAWWWHAREVSHARHEGWAAAVAAADKQYNADADAARREERALRDQFVERANQYHLKEQTYDQNLVDAQRRMRAGVDSLRCPAASAVQASAAPADRPAAAGAAPDEPGAPVVPAVAGDILGLAADTGRLVRKLEEVTARYDACRALNNGAPPAD
ncbi:hypothetical protein E7V67_011625 [[Empedobacter] haloabium]|uniref:Lysis protein n=1 Tax=[Empedobacter] haloabium TaxID=592317 RepID=A0ABZ1UTT3_9BURK